MNDGAAGDIAQYISALPAALQPAYKTATTNETIGLYAGPLRIKQRSVWETEGVIEWTWLPTPGVTFRYPIRWNPDDIKESLLTPLSVDLADAEIELSAASGTPVTNAQILSVSTSSDGHGEVRGAVREIELGTSVGLARVMFHLPNCSHFHGEAVYDQERRVARGCRATTIVGDWRLTIENIVGSEKTSCEAERTKGHAITHVGSIERIDRATFAANDVSGMVDSLYQFLSFCCGSWTGPVLLAGYDGAGMTQWQKWSSRHISPWLAVQSWFSTLRADGMKALPGFVARSQDPTWKEPIQHAIHWYVEANRCAGGIEGAIILTQAALELLSWTLFVADRRTISASNFDKRNAADKIALLLADLGIPQEIPASLGDLTTAAAAAKWDDAPKAIVAIRNCLVHPSPKNRGKLRDAPVEARCDAWCLGLWCLELSILRLCGYSGKYANRLLRDVHRGDDVQDVPWASSPPSGT